VRFLNRSVNGWAGRISRRRRGPLAGLLVLVTGLLMMGGLYTAFSPAQAQSEQTTEELVAEGRELFIVNCSFCHGQNGEGVRSVDGNQLGPSLVGVGAAAVDFQVGTGRMPAAQPGQQLPRKEEVFSQDEIDALAADVASLGVGPAVPDESDYSLEGLSDEERQEAIVRGGQIFLTNCTACHNFTGSGGAMPRGGYAPRILGVEPRYVYQAMLTGPQTMPTFSDGNLTPEAKRDVIAYLESINENPKYGGFGMGGLGPVAEGMYAWIVGIGVLVGFAIWIAAHGARSTKQKVDA
jgi:ubiquinol-cytochrome c reductase cytochrome c subunit